MGDNFHPQDNHIPMAEDNANIENGTTSIAADAEVATATIATPTLPPQAQMEDMSNEVKLDQEMASTQPPPPQAQELLHEDNVAASNVMMNDASEAAAAAAAVEGLAVETVPGTAMDENGVPIPTDFAIPTDGMINATNDAHQIHHHHHHMDHSTGALESSMPALPPTTLADPTTPAAPSTDNNMAMAMAPPITLTSPAPTRTLITPKKSSTKQERMDAIWMKHYKELQQYKVENQHVRVPRKSGPLGEWVRTQRRYYKLWRRGESVPLTKERMELLDQLGFVWLPAEEKVGGGFRGGRPKKRKREEEDALAAANAAAVAAAAAGAVAVAGGHHHMVNTAFYHNLASPALAAGATAAANATDGTLEDHVDVDMEEQVEGTMMPGGVNVDGVLPSVATPLVATSGIPYNYHHDPFYLHSISKRNDITNQIGLLEKHEPLNRPAGNGGVKEIFKTQKLTESHSHYEDVVSVLKRSNEELRDAELALDRAKKTYDQAQQLKDKADALLSSASEEVLMAELEEGDDEWIGMYKCLVKYQDHHGNILFPRISNTANNTAEEEVTDEAVSVSNIITYGTIKQESEEQPVDVAAIAAMKAEEQVVEQIDINTAPTTATPTTDEQLENLGEAPLVENPIDEAQPTAEIDGKEDEVVENNAAVVVDASDEANNETKTDGETAEAMEVDIDGSTQADTTLENSATVVDASTEQVAGDGTIEVTAADLHDWVGKMRKFPKKQLKKWRRYALNKLGFVWHQYNATWTDRYRELVEFREKHGHTVVPTSNSNLGIWVGTQRKQYRLMQQEKPSHMTVERVEMLNEIGFVWHVNTWNERFEELKAFKEQFGHFLVPTDYHNRQLRPWITTQRSHYRFMQEGKASQLTQDRIDMLDKINFPWKTREDWQTRYQELVQFIEENGNCAVPRNYTRFPKLYRWVNCQRMEYQKYQEGSGSRLKVDQISLLENVGFE